MKLIVSKNFYKDLQRISDIKLLDEVENFMIQVGFVRNLFDLKEYKIKKMKWYTHFYRVRFWDYRLWLEVSSDTVILRRILLRKDIYKYFP